MAKTKYQNIRMNSERLDMVRKINKIISEYQAQGYGLTLRQIYYRLVALDNFPHDRTFTRLPSGKWIRDPQGTVNAEPNYKWLGDIISDGRMSGLIDWEAIEDRTRELDGNNHWASPSDIISAVGRSYMIDKWTDQKYRLEIWVEKDALEGVVGNAARAMDIDFFSCRGYASQTSIHDHAQRLRGYMAAGQQPIILHFGDFDPSGLDMTRDIRERLNNFLMRDWLDAEMDIEGKIKIKDILADIEGRCGAKAGIEVKRLALTMAQIKQYNPPPNPAKVTDARFKKFQEEYGDESWELDALDPSVIDALIRNEVKKYREERKFNDKQDQEREEKNLLRDVSIKWEGVVEFLENDD